MTIHGSGRPRWFNIAEIRSLDDIPVVTVFGAGVSGLSLAHELVERGFCVQVVEAEPHPDREYAVRIGGLAANQYGRIPAELERLHPYLFSDTGRGADGEALDAEWQVIVRLGAPSTLKQWVIVDDHPPIPFAASPSDLDAIATEVKKLPGLDALVTGNELAIWSTEEPPKRSLPLVTAVEDDAGKLRESRAILVESPNTLLALRADSLKPVQPRFPIRERIYFERIPSTMPPKPWEEVCDDHGIPNRMKLESIAATLDRAYLLYEKDHRDAIDRATEGTKDPDFADRLSKRMARREKFFVEICGHTDGEKSAEANRNDSKEWAETVRDHLAGLIGEFDLLEHCVTIGSGDLFPIGNPRRSRGRNINNRVEIRIVEHVIPGEHGYRYFPRFYRNLFDTMRRTPILDAEGRETGETAFDRLVPTTVVDLATKPPLDGPIPVPIRKPLTLEGLRELVARVFGRAELRIPARDVLRFQVRMLQYATSSELRRREYEKSTWAEFIELPKYGDEMQALLNLTPESLVGMNASETDARTQGTILLQLLLDTVSMDGVTNATLNGPTSEVWMEDWKRYLTRQGVRFFHGKLSRLVWKGDRLLPVTTVARGRGLRILLSVQETGAIDCTIAGVPVDPDVPSGTPRVDHVMANINAISGLVAKKIGSLDLLEVARESGTGPIEVSTQGDGVRVVGAEPEIATQDFSGPTWFDDPPGFEGGPDFYVLAVPYLEASRLAWEATLKGPGTLDGCFAQLLDFDKESGRCETDAAGNVTRVRFEPERDGWGRPVDDPGGKSWPLRDLSGIQFYFDRQSRIGSAHTYYVDANWGLSSIAQIAYWRERVSRDSAFLGQLSVDVGRWYWHGEGVRSSAWRTPPKQIAEEVWRQIDTRLAPLPGQLGGPATPRIAPAYYHLDEDIRFDHPDGLHFSRAQIDLQNGAGKIRIRVNGALVEATKAGIAAEIEQVGRCAVIRSGDRLFVGPRVDRQEGRVVFVFDDDVANTTYRVLANGKAVDATGANALAVAKELAKQINQNVPGVVAEAAEPKAGASVTMGVTVGPGVSISAVALDSTKPDRPCFWMLPTGVVQVLPIARADYANEADATPARNASPFLINAAGERTTTAALEEKDSIWASRPGNRISEPGGRHGASTRIFYEATKGRWFMTGNHMATWTRLSTMESANESARHAANAIVHTVLTKASNTSLPARRGEGTVVADVAPIWNPEEHEIEDADPLKRLDEQLCKDGLPHFMEILRVDDWIDGDPQETLSDVFSAEKLIELKSRLRTSGVGNKEDWRAAADAGFELLRRVFDTPGATRS